jgi:hypothetical protein
MGARQLLSRPLSYRRARSVCAHSDSDFEFLIGRGTWNFRNLATWRIDEWGLQVKGLHGQVCKESGYIFWKVRVLGRLRMASLPANPQPLGMLTDVVAWHMQIRVQGYGCDFNNC